ncbi:MAG: hypothetical protein CENE_01304 [Candidatus Celerinatantimonas neptuna]|nr:MAG: hypothetical protein CENE_01304 [Candidatus Celerinatantimonas neptuna]
MANTGQCVAEFGVDGYGWVFASTTKDESALDGFHVYYF